MNISNDDLDALVAEIERCNLRAKYAQNLASEVAGYGAETGEDYIHRDQYTGRDHSGWAEVVAMEVATPAQRYRAALKTVFND